MPERRRRLTSSPTTRFTPLTSLRMVDTYFHEDCTQMTWSSSPMPIVEGLITVRCNAAGKGSKTREWVGPPQNPPTFFSCPIAQLPVDDSVDPFNRHKQEELLKAL